MPRFFVAASNIFGGVAYINGKDTEHFRALRIRQGERFVVCDGAGKDYNCKLTSLTDEGAEAEIIDIVPSQGEPDVECTVFAAFAKGDKLETVIQKSVELGAAGVVLFPSARCVSKPDSLLMIKKTARYQKIAEEAAKQSGRGRIPKVTCEPTFEQAMKAAALADLPLFFYEDEKKLGLKTVLDDNGKPMTVSIVTGPEGGFEPEEASFAAECGMKKIGRASCRERV
jgi:16S rRNA (uracil1498-N3)-methyltransferase